MAHRVVKQFVDDIDGSEDDVRTVRIWVPFEHAPDTTYNTPSTSYEIDLSRANRDAYVKALEPFLANARRVSGFDPEALRPGEGQKVREWAEKQKITLKPKGRIPKDVLKRFREETN